MWQEFWLAVVFPNVFMYFEPHLEACHLVLNTVHSAVDRSLSNLMNESIQTGTRLAVAADPSFFSSESCLSFNQQPTALRKS